MQFVITPKQSEVEDPITKANRIADKLGVELSEEDHKIIKFGFNDYK